jgi:hypothetical protein
MTWFGTNEVLVALSCFVVVLVALIVVVLSCIASELKLRDQD